MKILFIGNYALGPGGEAADETHLAREMERAGHTVFRVPRDEWREYVRENGPQNKYKVPEGITVDIILIAKWHHFYDGSFIKYAREKYSAPVMYWVWDYMEGNSVEDWHMKMAQEADLYLSGEIGLAHYYHSNNVRFYYMQFDSCDGDFPPMIAHKKLYDVVYMGSCINQNGRIDLLKAINKEVPIKVFGYDYQTWIKEGFDASPGVYNFEFNKVVAQSNIILGTSAGPNCYGYWSNRVGKVLYCGGFLLQLYTPGMEQTLSDCCEFFNSPQEAVEKIKYYLANPNKKDLFYRRNTLLNRDRWTSEYKIRQLMVLIDRFLKTNKGELWMLP